MRDLLCSGTGFSLWLLGIRSLSRVITDRFPLRQVCLCETSGLQFRESAEINAASLQLRQPLHNLLVLDLPLGQRRFQSANNFRRRAAAKRIVGEPLLF